MLPTHASLRHFLTLMPFYISDSVTLHDIGEKFHLWQIASGASAFSESNIGFFKFGYTAPVILELLEFVEFTLRPLYKVELEVRVKMNRYAKKQDTMWSVRRRSRATMHEFICAHLTIMQRASLDHIIDCRESKTPTIALNRLLGIGSDLLRMVEHYVALEVEGRELARRGEVAPDRVAASKLDRYTFIVRYCTADGARYRYQANTIADMRASDMPVVVALARGVYYKNDNCLLTTKQGTAKKIGTVIHVTINGTTT